ncbi:DNA recombination protein RmuC [Shewanella cyperi]|uniref:DNA recombination protein RmuC n=1 Tax=Shewanella cyperi TaxID=2814292 RepID=A0A974XQK2_9GAMM|nr:DNA recombination protein RmuC [Shewanella cyperi]QSX31568.1 DNA recombination protein RmuC [Shewanella cyperi]
MAFSALDFSIPQWIAIAALSFLTLLLGALLNQKLTRSRWDMLSERQQQQLAEREELLNQELGACRQQLEQARHKLELLHQSYGQAKAEAERTPALEQELADNRRRLMECQLALSKSNAMQQTLSAKFDAEKQALADKLQLLENAETRLNQQFENLANKIFEDKANQFQGQNNQQLNALLGPFKQQLEGFRQQVNESYSREQSERSALKHQLETLKELNLRMSQDAINLTNALKGDNKQQGNWGEVILERVLSESGLREGHEYHTQAQHKDDKGKLFKPDVVVHLPGNKDVVIDAKMSLLAYERCFNASDEDSRQAALKEHVQSVRNHIKGLSLKDYQQLHGLQSLDYVLMFIPVEPAFLLALEQDPTLVNYALEHNIMLASPTNLLVALRTIHNIWRYEYQNQHAQQIAKAAGRIYDKLCGFLDDMDKLGRTLESSQKSFQAAMGKLVSGKGNLVRQAHQMRELGVDTSKQLERALLEKALDDTLETMQPPE